MFPFSSFSLVKHPATLFCFLTSLFIPWGAAAEVLTSARIRQVSREVQEERTPLAYVKLASLVAATDENGLFDEVEKALHTVANSKQATPHVRAYAGWLELRARHKRGDLKGAEELGKRLGYLNRFLFLGPFLEQPNTSGFSNHLPEQEQTAPISLKKPYEEQGTPRFWRMGPDVFPYGMVHIGALFQPKEWTCSYALTFVQDSRPKDTQSPRTLSVLAGSAGALQLFWNGRKVLEDPSDRALEAERWGAALVLEPGWNRLLIKVCSRDEGGKAAFAVRLGEADGSPASGLLYDPDPVHSEHPISPAAIAQSTTPPTGGELGILQQLRTWVQDHAPAKQEALTRYLVWTHSDERSGREQRALASQAANTDPTIPRLLLASALSMDPLQQATWLDKAEAMLQKKPTQKDKRDLLLSQAERLAASLSPRDAIPLYQALLAMEPARCQPRRQLASLYTNANLLQTALTTLSGAPPRCQQHPLLLRDRVNLLTHLARKQEAQNYTQEALRRQPYLLDLLEQEIDRLVAQRNKPQALRRLALLLSLEPSRVASLYKAAEVYTAFGDPGQAMQALEHAREIAPENTETLHKLADAFGLAGNKEKQISLLQRILELTPHDSAIRSHFNQLTQHDAQEAEVYLQSPSTFLARRQEPPRDHTQRTHVQLQVTTLFPNGHASRFHQVVFEPLTQEAAADAQWYTFLFEASQQSVQLRRARVYHVDGTTEESIQSLVQPWHKPDLRTYTSLHQYAIQLPNLQPRDVVELQYLVEDLASSSQTGALFGEMFSFPTTPTGHAEYIVRTPKEQSFVSSRSPFPWISSSVELSGKTRIFRFWGDNLQPSAEALPRAAYGERAYVHFASSRSWQDVGKAYGDLIQSSLVANDEIRTQVQRLTQHLTRPADKVRALYQYVVTQVRYLALELGIYGIKPYPAEQILAQGFGDCKDKAALLMTMLREAGVPAQMVLVRTRSQGDLDTATASLAPFDHALVYVPSLDLYLDGTAEYSGSKELPPMDQGAFALLVDPFHARIVHLPETTQKDNLLRQEIQAHLTWTGAAELVFDIRLQGDDAAAWRKESLNPTLRDKLLEKWLLPFPGIVLHRTEARLPDIEKPAHFQVHATTDRFAQPVGKKGEMSFSILPHTPWLYRLAARPAETRRITIPLRTEETSWSLHLPKGAKVASPPSTETKSLFGAYSLLITRKGDTLYMRTKVSLTKRQIAPHEYQAFRAWCGSIDRALHQQIVLSRE